MFNALIVSIFLYNSELWALTKKEAQKMHLWNNFLIKIIRSKRRIKKHQPVQKIQNRTMDKTLIYRKEDSIKWFGPRKCLIYNVPGLGSCRDSQKKRLQKKPKTKQQKVLWKRRRSTSTLAPSYKKLSKLYRTHHYRNHNKGAW